MKAFFFWACTNSHLAPFWPRFSPLSCDRWFAKKSYTHGEMWWLCVVMALTKGFMFKDSAHKETSDAAKPKRGRKKKVCCFLLTSTQACYAGCSGEGRGWWVSNIEGFLLPLANGFNVFFPFYQGHFICIALNHSYSLKGLHRSTLQYMTPFFNSWSCFSSFFVFVLFVSWFPGWCRPGLWEGGRSRQSHQPIR